LGISPQKVLQAKGKPMIDQLIADCVKIASEVGCYPPTLTMVVDIHSLTTDPHITVIAKSYGEDFKGVGHTTQEALEFLKKTMLFKLQDKIKKTQREAEYVADQFRQKQGEANKLEQLMIEVGGNNGTSLNS
jgi:hypothetical protein